MMHDILTGGQKILGPDEYFHIALPLSPKDNIWSRFRISIILCQGMPAARLTATMTVLPESKQAQQSETQNSLVRIMSLLDEELLDYIEQNNIDIERNPRLFHLINAVHNVSPLSNITELHRFREIRNSISHDLNPQELSWEDINDASDTVEKTLIELGALTFTTNFKLAGIENTAVEISNNEGEKYTKSLILRINQGELLYCEYTWKYIFY